MIVYLIAGKAGSGKTLAASMLKNIYEKQGKKAVITEYSKYIKLFAKDLTLWDGVSEPKPRDFLQEMGDYVRTLKKDIYFVERMKEDLQIYQNFVDVVIISDVRMPKELDELAEYHPVKIKVVQSTLQNHLTEKQANHITEHALDEYDAFDYVLQDLSVEKLERELEIIVERNEEK